MTRRGLLALLGISPGVGQIGPDCINPHYDHWRWECFTAESAAADYEAARAEAKEE